MKPATDDANRRQEIRRFLMTKRAAISPEAAGFPSGTRRRTPGLRREEIASLAGIGATWYTWFEQGRDIQVSSQALKRISQALRLTSSDTAYLFSLCGLPLDEQARNTSEPATGVRAVLDGFLAGPALMLNACFDVLAFNRLADLVFDFDGCSGPFARNHVWRFFMDPRRHKLYVERERMAEISASTLRLLSGRMIGDPYVESLIHELRQGSPEFRRLWDAQRTMPLDPVSIAIQLPKLGRATFTSVRFHPVNAPDQLLVLLPPADTSSARFVEKLRASKSRQRG
jgi:transcriptional regulator with XRE-family HTH domain